VYPPGFPFFSRGSFQTPVDPPTTQPDADPRQAVCVNQDWLPFIAGALKQLELQATWKVADDAALLDVQGRVFDLISKFGRDVPGCCFVPYNKMCLSGSFADSDYGFLASSGFSCDTVWVPGSGWTSCPPSIAAQRIEVERSFGGVTHINSFQVEGTCTLFAGTLTINITFSKNGTTVATGTAGYVGGGNFNTTFSPNIDCDFVQVEILTSAAIGSRVVYTNWEICYTGLYPLSSTVTATWSHTFDFTVDDGGFTTIPIPGETGGSGTWVSGSGWRSDFTAHSGPNGDQIIFAQKFFPQRRISTLEVFYTLPTSAGGSKFLIIQLGGVQVDYFTLSSVSGSHDILWIPGEEADELRIDFGAAGPTALQYTYCTKLIVTGVGTDPF